MARRFDVLIPFRAAEGHLALLKRWARANKVNVSEVMRDMIEERSERERVARRRARSAARRGSLLTQDAPGGVGE